MNRERLIPPGIALFVCACLLPVLVHPTRLAAQDIDPSRSPAESFTLAPAGTDTQPENVGADRILIYADPDSQTGGSAASPKSDWEKPPGAWNTIIYPIFAWAPVMGADVRLPEIPAPPSGGGPVTPEGTTSGSFNGAAFAGFEVLKSGWSVTGNVLYAGLSGDRTSPKVHLGLDVIFGQLMGGRNVYKGLSVEGGFRRMALNITADVDDYPEEHRKPGVWDPLIGATYRRQLGKKWRLVGTFDGGGFGVGCDYDFSEGGRADWRFAKHFGLSMGMSALQFKITNTVSTDVDGTLVSRTLKVAQTLYGPVFGFGIYF